MIELIVITRMVVDFFWEYKALSGLHALLAVVVVVLVVSKAKKDRFKVCEVDKLFFLFVALTVFSLSRSFSDSALNEYFKFFAYLGFYFSGRALSAKIKSLSSLGVFSCLSLLGLSVSAVAGFGYTSWGGISTFTGGYFFKTDMAIASLIFLVFVFATVTNRLVLAFSLVLAAYLVFKSNARIALPLVVIIPIFVMMALHGKLKSINLKSVVVVLAAAVMGMAMFALVDFRSIGMLGFDFSDPFSAANTQGRSVIWAALLQAFTHASLVSQLFGSGLNADVEATRLFSESLSLEGVRAHNSYLYLLLCMGVMGSLAFYWLIYSVLNKAVFLLKQDDHGLRVVPTISCAFIVMFCWLSMTTEIVIRPQLMILLFFFSGLHVQSYLKVKKAVRANLREIAHSP